jgi:hypothetical protein
LTFLRRTRALSGRDIFLLAVTFAAVVSRLAWNIAVHPPRDHLYSDMVGYFERATELLRAPLAKVPSAVLFPYGTHALIAGVRFLFGSQNHFAVAVVYALLGAALVPLDFLLSERLDRGRLAPRVAAIVALFHYPWISLGGYYLSEIPFAVCVTASALFALRLADRRRMRDALLFGAALALGATFRPQILIALPIVFLVLRARRGVFPPLPRARLAAVLAPVLVVLALSAARFHHHTGRFGFVSANSGLNLAFGRCHAAFIETRARGHGALFGPPPLGFLAAREKKNPRTFARLDAALEEKLVVAKPMWEESQFHALAMRCVETTGLVRQIRYSAVHLLLLFGYNNVWPDSGTDDYRTFMRRALDVFDTLFLPPLFVALALSLRRRLARHALLAAFVFGLAIVAVIYFGDVRYRVPYDGIVIVLGLSAIPRFVGWARARLGSGARV